MHHNTQWRRAAALTSGELAQQADRTGELVQHLHDSLAQLLSFALIQLDTAQRTRASARDSALQHSRLLVKEALRATRGLMGELRDVARTEPQAFEQQLVQMAADVSRVSCRELQIACQALTVAVPPSVSKILLRATRELLVNACKHAPGARIQLSLLAYPDGVAGLALVVSDNGPGLCPTALNTPAATSYGLRQLPAYLALIGAQLQLNSQAESGLCARVVWYAEPARAGEAGV